MSFETAKTVTSDSAAPRFNFARQQARAHRPQPTAAKQSINISRETLAKAAMRRLQTPHAPKLSYSPNGQFERGPVAGQFLNAVA